MAKKIIISGLTNNIPIANSGLKLSKNILIEKVEPHPKFQKLFNIEEQLKDRISSDMNDTGYDPSQPIHLWLTKDEEGIEHFYLIDGYTRVAAAKQAKLIQIPYYEHKFETFEEAYSYALKLQVNRRNLDNTTLFNNLQFLLGTDEIQNLDGKKAPIIAEKLGTGIRTVQKAMYIENNASEEDKERIKTGEASINQVYNEHHAKKSSKKDKTPKSDVSCSNENTDSDDISEALSDNTGTPSGLNFSHSDGVERPIISTTSETDVDTWTIEKNKQVETARKEGFADGFEKALIFALAEIKKGKTPEEVYNDDRLQDLSPSIICNFELPIEDEDIVGEFKL